MAWLELLLPGAEFVAALRPNIKKKVTRRQRKKKGKRGEGGSAYLKGKKHVFRGGGGGLPPPPFYFVTGGRQLDADLLSLPLSQQQTLRCTFGTEHTHSGTQSHKSVT